MELSKKTVKRILLIITFTVLLIWAIYNHKLLFKYIGELYSLISPFVIGLCIAYVVNVIMRPIERLWMKLLSKCKGKWVEKMKRPICLLLSILLVIGIILAVIFIIMPELSDSVSSLVSMVPSYVSEVESWWEALALRLDKYGVELPQNEAQPQQHSVAAEAGGEVQRHGQQGRRSEYPPAKRRGFNGQRR